MKAVSSWFQMQTRQSKIIFAVTLIVHLFYSVVLAIPGNLALSATAYAGRWIGGFTVHFFFPLIMAMILSLILYSIFKSVAEKYKNYFDYFAVVFLIISTVWFGTRWIIPIIIVVGLYKLITLYRKNSAEKQPYPILQKQPSSKTYWAISQSIRAIWAHHKKLLFLFVFLIILIVFGWNYYNQSQKREASCLQQIKYGGKGVDSYYKLEGGKNTSFFKTQKEALNYCLKVLK